MGNSEVVTVTDPHTCGMGVAVGVFVGVALASVNIFGGFLVTYRMLSMFKKKGR